MGKDIKGRKLGPGICQRKDKRYSARFTRRTGERVEKFFRSLPEVRNRLADAHLYKLCDKAGIRHFCMHALRHTFATRAIEAGVDPYILQKILGHSSVKTTMDRYVHVTDDAMELAIAKFQDAYEDGTDV